MRLIFLALASVVLFSAAFSGRSSADIPPAFEVYWVGADVAEAEPFPKLVNVVPGGPAAKAGLKDGDGVIAIDGGYSKGGAPFYYFARQLGGRENSEAELIVLRDGQQVLVVKLLRTYKKPVQRRPN